MKTIKVYTFDELSQKAKEKAIKNKRKELRNDPDLLFWFDCERGNLESVVANLMEDTDYDNHELLKGRRAIKYLINRLYDGDLGKKGEWTLSGTCLDSAVDEAFDSYCSRYERDDLHEFYRVFWRTLSLYREEEAEAQTSKERAIDELHEPGTYFLADGTIVEAEAC